MDRDDKESLHDSDLLPADVLNAIEREQQWAIISVEIIWRISYVMLVCSTVISTKVLWYQALALIVVMGCGTFIVERDINLRKKRVHEVRRFRMLLEDGDPNKNVHRYIQFINSSPMIPFPTSFQKFAHWLWIVATVLVVISQINWV